MSSSQVVELCQIWVKSNLQLCFSIESYGLHPREIHAHLKYTARKINELSKLIETDENKPRCKKEKKVHYEDEEYMPRCKKEKKVQYEGKEYNKLISRIEKFKQDRQNEVENDKKWSDMNDENDELIGRLKRLKPVELVEEPESDIYEILDKEEEEERKKDEYFEERERQDQLNRIEPDKSDRGKN